jgi:hypothetical protein
VGAIRRAAVSAVPTADALPGPDRSPVTRRRRRRNRTQVAPHQELAGGVQQFASPWASVQLKVAGLSQHSLPAQPLAGGWHVVVPQWVTVAAQTRWAGPRSTDRCNIMQPFPGS